MDIDELQEYPHRIKEISIINSNTESQYDTAMLKVTLPQEYSNEIIVFSVDKEMTQPIPKKRQGNDYFLTIPLDIKKIYAHYLIADLYDDEEEDTESDDVFISFDLKKLKKYINESSLYNVGDESHPKIISSAFIENTSNISTISPKDPNYKHYNKEAKGHFPITSRYAFPSKDKHMIITQVRNSIERLKTYNDIGYNRPSLEFNIPRKDIDKTGKIINDNDPINVFLNYEYLPSTTEYHQHFYGFTSPNEWDISKPKNVQVFEGDNLNIVNGGFFKDKNNDKYTYRLIHNNNDIKDYKHAIYIKHENIKKITIPNSKTECYEWTKNNCDNYYSYTTDTNIDEVQNCNSPGIKQDINLKPNTSYTLKYYTYIPTDIKRKANKSQPEIQYRDPQTNELLKFELNERFKEQDTNLRGQWIYHEIPFKTIQEAHVLYIPNHYNKGKSIYYSDFYIEEFVQYSPTIKYTDDRVIVVENNKVISNTYNTSSQSVSNSEPIPIKVNEPPIPHRNIYIDFFDEFDLRYNHYSKTLSYYYSNNMEGPKYQLCYKNEENCNEPSEIGNVYALLSNDNSNTPKGLMSVRLNNEEHEGYDLKDFCYNYNPQKVFYNGPNNSFSLKVFGDDYSPIARGYAECAIIKTSTKVDEIQNDSTNMVIKYLGRRYTESDGTINYTKLDLRNIDAGIYYLQINYSHPCYKDDFTEIRMIYIVDGEYEMRIEVEESDNNTSTYVSGYTKEEREEKITHGTYTVQNADEFPLEIRAHFREVNTNSATADGGYCVLSIDDEPRQNNYVSDDGVAIFFLNANKDNLQESQVIKIEYYSKKGYGEEEGDTEEITIIDYFTLKLKPNLDIKDAVPINFRILSDDAIEQRQQSISVAANDCLLIDIDTSDTNYTNYSIRLYETDNDVKKYLPINNDETYINIYNNVTSPSDSSIVIGLYTKDHRNTCQAKDIVYTMVTDSRIGDITNEGTNNENITYSNSKYRQHQKRITVRWEPIQEADD